VKLLTIALVLLPAARADDWPAPVVREVFSSSRAFFVRVIPGKSVGDTVGFSGAPKGPFATAEFFRQEKDRSYRLAVTVTLLNPVAPAEFFVTDRGALITLDNWHNRGYGKVVAFYSPEGKPIRAYDLSDLFNAAEIDRFEHSMSSIRWHEFTGSYIRPGEETFYVTVNTAGAGFIFEATRGTYQYCETREGKYLCRDSSQNRKWQAYREPDSVK
jgi:hypothetical protein